MITRCLIGVAVLSFGAATLKPTPGPASATASPIARATAPATARRRGNTDVMGIPSWFPDAESRGDTVGQAIRSAANERRTPLDGSSGAVWALTGGPALRWGGGGPGRE